MKRLSLLLAVILLTFSLNITAQEKEWVKPYANYNLTNSLTIERVVFTDTATTLFFHCKYVPRYWIRVASNCVLRCEGKDYPVRSAHGITLGERFYMPDSGETDFCLSFGPLPKSNQPFDFIEPNGWAIPYIRNQDYMPVQLMDTYWRNIQTGEWFIGFADDHIIYDGKIWQAVQTVAKKNAYKFILNRKDEESHRVTVSRSKKGVRHIAIDDQKAVACHVIKSSELGDYPKPDETSQWNKADITSVDTAYLCGWIKDMDHKNGNNDEIVKIYYKSIFSTSQQSVSPDIDSLGYFEIKLPIAEATPIFLGMERISLSSVLEPGKHYFVLCDFKTGHNLVMGEDARVQNELFAQQALSKTRIFPFYIQQESNPQITAEGYLDYILAAYANAQKNFEQYIQEHPTISARLREYVQNSLRIEVGENLGQANYYSNIKNCERYRQFMEDSCLARVPRPLTLYPSMFNLANDYCAWEDREPGALVSFSHVSAVKLLVRKGKLTPTEEEMSALKNYYVALAAYISEAQKANEEQRDSLFAVYEASPTVVNYTSLLERTDSADLAEATDIAEIENKMTVIRSLGCDSDFCDFFAEKLVLKQISDSQEPLNPNLEAYVKTTISNPVAEERVLEENQKYIDLKNGNYERIQKSLKTINFGNNVHGGKQMLAEILKPLQGKFVLIDIWGTWCAPCRAALEHSQELYESLADYDIAFVYLANRSTDEAWKNVIETCNVVGDNVYHYNLPEQQQTEIESALGINSFPSYCLFDSEGNLLDVNVDARIPQNLKSLLDTLGAKKGQ